VVSKKKDIAHPGDRDSTGLGRKRPPFDSWVIVVEQNLIDFRGAEAGDFNRRLSDDKFFEFESLSRQGSNLLFPPVGSTQCAKGDVRERRDGRPAGMEFEPD
jgi:hypothetical protein